MPQIIPIKNLKNTSEISELCHSTSEPVYVTKNGYGDMVIMSMEVYEKIRSGQCTDTVSGMNMRPSDASSQGSDMRTSDRQPLKGSGQDDRPDIPADASTVQTTDELRIRSSKTDSATNWLAQAISEAEAEFEEEK